MHTSYTIVLIARYFLDSVLTFCFIVAFLILLEQISVETVILSWSNSTKLYDMNFIGRMGLS